MPVFSVLVSVDWIYPAQDRVQCWVHSNEPSDFMNAANFLINSAIVQILCISSSTLNLFMSITVVGTIGHVSKYTTCQSLICT
jgi:hypothetical protein